MVLPWMILLLIFGGLLAWVLGRSGPAGPRIVSYSVLLVNLILAALTWTGVYGSDIPAAEWIAEFRLPWVPGLGIGIDLAMDGLSILLVILSLVIGIVAVASTRTQDESQPGFFHLCLLWTLSGVLGVFLAMDLILFYFFWELMLIPMFFLIAVWGHEQRAYAAIKFFIFTQVSGLFLLASILGLFFIHANATGNFTFYLPQLIGTKTGPGASMLLMLGFVAAFAVKLPVVPFHTWLPDAHAEAPTAGSIILAALLLKTGAYGLLRLALPLFPAASGYIAPAALALGVAGVLYGAFMSYAQIDLKRLVAYTSVSHMGFVLLGIYAGTAIALQGAILQIICHAFSTGALFVIAGFLQDRLQTRELGRMGGLWPVMPRLGSVTIFFALASMGLPGIGNFIAEFLVLLGTFQVNIPAAVLASAGLVFSTIYALTMVRRVFFGPPPASPVELSLPDLSWREAAVIAPMIAILLWIGFYPQPLMNTAMNTVSVKAGRTGIISTGGMAKDTGPLRIEKIFPDRRQPGGKGEE